MVDQTNRRNIIYRAASSVEILSFFTSFLLVGIQRCSGIFYFGILELSDENRLTAAIPFIISRSIECISSVVSKGLTDHQKKESSILCGTLMCAIGAGISFISNNVIWLSACWGIIFGTGVGIAFPEAMEMSQKFRSQNFFNVLFSAAPSLACIVMPYLMQYLLSSYGLNGCLLVLCGFILNIVPLALATIYGIPFNVLIPKWRIRKKYEIEKFKQKTNGCNASKTNSIEKGIDNDGFELENNEGLINTEANLESNPQPNSNGIRKVSTHSHIACPYRMDSLLEVSNENDMPYTLRENKNSVIEAHDKDCNKALFEKSFSEEDVIFEVIPRNIDNTVVRRKSNGDDDIESSNFKTQNISPQNKKKILTSISERTLNESPHCTISCPRRTLSGPAKRSLTGLHKNTIGRMPKNAINDPLKRSICGSAGVHSMNKNLPTTQITPNSPIKRNFPLEIKVHVVECTFTASDFQMGRALHTPIRTGYRKHSNSLITSSYDNIDFNSLHFSKKYHKSPQLSTYPGKPSSTMYLISEDEEFGTEITASNRNSGTGRDLPKKTKPRLGLKNPFKKILKLSCLVVIYSYAIYEITLSTMLTIFADLVSDASGDKTSLVTGVNGVLSAFGVGGIAGKLSLRYWGNSMLSEGSNAAAAVLFILDGVVIAGILWSPNIYWTGGFYAFLGFLEVGISTTIWNLISDYIEEDAKSSLFSTCAITCGLVTLCVPYTIGLSRDTLGEYDGLLQIASCLSVLCAVLCYILPKFSSSSKRFRGS